MQLHVEGEMVRRCRAPSFNGARVRNRVERRVDFDHVKMLGVPGEPFVRCHFLWIPAFNKSRVAPTRGADENFTAVVSWDV